MRTDGEAGQLSLFGPDLKYGRTSPARSARRAARTSEPFSRKLQRLRTAPLQFLDLRAGHGNLLGSYWETSFPSLTGLSTRNFGECPNADVESSLSQILQDTAPDKYYLSKTACLGILRRSSARGKELPPVLKEALEIQAGLRAPADRKEHGGMKAYHINQRDEGIDLDGVSGALMATANCQMQTFVTGHPTAFAANRRDEVRELHDVAGALTARPGVKQQTFIAVFCAGAAPTAGGIGYQEETAPTLRAAESGTNMAPSVLCLNDQGGRRMDISENATGTLRADMGGHPPLVLGSGQGNACVEYDLCPTLTEAAGTSGNNPPVLFENHGIASRYNGPLDVAPTISARGGTGGNNLSLVKSETYCIAGNTIDRQPENGGNGSGCAADVAYSLTTVDRHAVFNRLFADGFIRSDIAGCECARQYKDATDLVLYAQNAYSAFGEGCGTLRASGGSMGGGSESLVVGKKAAAKLIRRLTPLECERLQGFPDHWTDIPTASDAKRYKALGNSVAIPCVEYIMRRIMHYIKNEKEG